MAIHFGEDNISRTQRHYLTLARQVPPVPEILQILHTVVTDGDIVSGREDLHPEWASLFEQYRSRLQAAQGRLDSGAIQTVLSAFYALQPIDQLAYDIDPAKEDIVFLLGAGASKPSPSDIPTVTELLPELLDRARRLDREQVTSLADFCKDQRIDNIEDLLTAVQISAFCSRNPGILRLVEFQLFGGEPVDRSRLPVRSRPRRADISSVAYIQDTLQVLFGLLSNLMLPANPNKGHEAIVEYIINKPSTPIITTNYDCCMDLALIDGGVPPSYNVEFANPGVLGTKSGTACHLIKLHGSLNWFYCETCQQVRLIDIKQTVEDYRNQRGEYPIISVCNDCGGQRRGLLVPPHAMKFDVAPPLQPLIADAASYFEKATLIVVVGFSFADADLYISRMLTKAMQESNITRMVIVDPDAMVAEKIRRKFESQIPNSDAASRIVKLQGDCSEMLPRFLGGELFRVPVEGNAEQPSEDLQAIGLDGT